ncbi:MAG TPA: SurA N-terminal domain-containing protein [Albitalea sp.]|nr:SurA N-terminal domain-containing protein [Albitalea sp.]
MFDFIRNHSRLIQAIMFPLILLAFGLVGIQGYSRFTGDSATNVAKVAGHNVSQAEWEAEHRRFIDRARRARPEIDAKQLDTPELRRQSLDNVVREHVMLAAVDKLNLMVSDARLAQLFATDPQFAFLRNPDGSVNKELLSAQGMSSEQFAQRLRQDLSMRQVMLGVGGTVMAPAAAASAALDAFFQQREIQQQRFDPKDYVAKVTPSDADIDKYYKDPANAKEFQAPEQASAEYVVFDLETMKKGVTVTDDELRKLYAADDKRFTTPEERRASHIMIKAEPDRAKAKAKAEALLAEVKKNPASFAELARKNSQDPVSAEKGGDTDLYVGRGDTDKPYEDALFALKKGETSGVVDTKDGFFIIQLTDVRGGQKKNFEEVRAELDAELRKKLAAEQYTKLADEFSNFVEQPIESLKPAAEKFKLELHTANNIARTPAPGASGPFTNSKLLEALFSADSIRNKRNTYAIEVGPNQLVSARLLQYQPARTLPVADVTAKIRAKLVTQQAAALARKDGEARLAALKKAPETPFAGESTPVSRAQARDVARPVLDAALRADPAKLPAFEGVDLGTQGYVVVKVNKVLGRDPVAADATRAQTEYTRAWGEAEAAAYYNALKSRFKVELHPPPAADAASAAGR